MKKKTSRIIGIIMVVIAIIFVVFAINHPEMFFPWSSPTTYLLYGVYGFIMTFFLIAPTKKK